MIGAEAAGVAVDERGFIASDLQMKTNVPHIYSIGDVRGEPMLAHKATHEGSLAAEVIAGEDVSPGTCARSRASPTPTPRSPGPG